MLDHLGLLVSDYAKSKRFFENGLAPLGYKLIMESDGSTAGLGANDNPDFWISQGSPAAPVHVAFASPDRATVDAFHKAAPLGGIHLRIAT
jgi:catechol 2,3-dioxygenase-like lactoylglutathione lyase family enzyme